MHQASHTEAQTKVVAAAVPDEWGPRTGRGHCFPHVGLNQSDQERARLLPLRLELKWGALKGLVHCLGTFMLGTVLPAA